MAIQDEKSGQSKPNVSAVTPTSSAKKGDSENSEPVGTVLPAVHAKKVEVTDEVRLAREDAKERLSSEIAAAKEMNKRQEDLLTPKETDTVSIKLKKAHAHSGVAYKINNEIKVDEQSAAFIEEHGIGERI